jgi:hypothetical protein
VAQLTTPLRLLSQVIASPVNAEQQACRGIEVLVPMNVMAALACPSLLWQVLLFASCMVLAVPITSARQRP